MALDILDICRSIYNSVDLGLIIINENNKIESWNSFMTHYSMLPESEVVGRDLFNLFPDLPKVWLLLKFKGVRQLQNPSKVSWEQRSTLFKFANSETMMQNCSFIPITNTETGENLILITIQDVSDFANNKIELNELIEINKSLEEISNYDALTEIYNRRYIGNVLNVAIETYKKNLVVVMLDLDHFKRINDTYGHIIGDKVLKYICRIVLDDMLEGATLGRFGGEEFLIIVKGVPLAKIMDWLEIVRYKISEGYVISDGEKVTITASFGVAEFDVEVKDDLEIIHRADVAMYRSKNSGRNKITLFSPS